MAPLPTDDSGDSGDSGDLGLSTDRSAGRPRPRWTVVIATIVAVLLVAEVGARVLGTRLDDPDWNVAEVAAHIDNLDRLDAESEQVDTLLIGSSSIGAAVDPASLAEQIEGVEVAYNANLFGPSAQAVEQVTDELLLQRLDPEVMVIGVTSRELNDNSADQARMLTALETSVGWRRLTGESSPYDRLDDSAGSISALVRFRPLLRDPETLARRVVDGPGSPISEFGMLTSRDGQRFDANNADHNDQERSALSDYAIGGEQLESLERVVTTQIDTGRRVVLVNMPVVDDLWWSLHPDPEGDRAAYEAAIAELVAMTGVEYFDAASEFDHTTADFGDANHLNEIGADRFTTVLADHLAG